ncbi:hypothetical protein BGZ98_006909 [Dissophora globulifera]|nr:hypothetical protein BGZ98_006909 [Dissophora globulifera]
MSVTGSAFVDFVIGFAVSLIASVMNAAGLNLLKLDHVRNSSVPAERQRNECGRPMWHVGLYLYIASQLAGSTVALNFLKTQWVAPLGSIALIFNFVFAKILVGTQITRQDVYGTIVVMASVIWIVVFGGMNSGGDIEDTLTLTDLKALFARVAFIIYFSILNAIIFSFLALGMYAYWAISLDDESGQLRKKMKTRLTQLLGTNRFARASGLTLEGDEGLEAEARELRLRKVVAMIMSACGGLLASETLLLAKSGVKLITSTVGGQNQFTDNLSYFILFILVFTAVLQVYCLNTGLKLYDSVLVVPTFYGFYTAFGLINSTIYLNQLGSYQPWVLVLVLIGIICLIYGVKMLSTPKPEQTPSGGQLSTLDNTYDDEEEDSHETGQRSNSTKGGRAGAAGSKGSKLGKFSLKKKRSSKRQSRQGAGLDEENDIPSIYGSQRGILDSDDITSDFASTINGVGGPSGRGRGMSFASKSSFQSDPFRTPKDGRSINVPFGEQEETPTHVLVDTTEDLNDSDTDGHDVRERERRRHSMLQSSFNTLTMHEKPADVDITQQRQGHRRPTIDTATAQAGRESARFSSPSGAMSPSQFKAHLMGAMQQSNSQQYQNGPHDSNPHSTVLNNSASPPWTPSQRGHSVRWSTGSSKIDQVFEDLNPFKTLKNRDPASVTLGSIADVESSSASLPSSPRQPSSASRPGQHGRQESFSGLPSEWEVPGRKKRHSMLFGEAGRSGSSGLISPTSGTTDGTASTTTTAVASTSSSGASSFDNSSKQVTAMDQEPTPSQRTSRILSSPEIQLGPHFR